ncbi:transcriptional regulator FilR1 domain-containing protein [Halalkalicoccus jeotgali]|nr:winged helix-turn-helix domain-containing protein [Halalkalicoccus jeotgali]
MADSDRERIARNPLTDKRIIVREFINGLSDSSRLAVLQALQECDSSAGASAIARQADVARRTASSHLSDCLSLGLLNQMSDTNEYRLTVSGQSILQSLERFLDEANQTQLADITRSQRRIELLRTLSVHPVTPGEVISDTPESPSHTTVWRALHSFAGYGWCDADGHSYQLTSSGKDTLHAYEHLEVVAEQAIEKAPFLQRLSPRWSDFPTYALQEADLVVSTPGSPGLVSEAALKLCDPRISNYRSLTSVYSPTLFKMYYRLLSLGMHGEGIIDASVYEKIAQNEDMQYLLDTSSYEHYDLLRLDERLTLGIGLYDEQKIAIGTYNEVGEGRHTAIIVSTHEDLIEWGTEIYQACRQQAVRTTDPSE